jgi:hypothetical protein
VAIEKWSLVDQMLHFSRGFAAENQLERKEPTAALSFALLSTGAH